MTQVPRWFVEAVARRPERSVIEVLGAEVVAYAWGDRADPGIVLVHGGAAHAGWWSALAPFLAVGHRVVALDLSGHGASGWRNEYHMEHWSQEILAAHGRVGGAGRPVVVGHSMGGIVTIVTAARYGSELAGAIVLDAPVQRPDPESEEGSVGRMFRKPKTYPDLATALEHFHLVPPQPYDNPWIVDHVARGSLRETDEGWTWRFDPRIFASREGESQLSDFAAALTQMACRVAVINGARSAVVDDDTRAYMAELLAGSPAAVVGIPVVEVPEARHHLMLDQPIAVVAALRSILASWDPLGQPPPQVPGDRP